MLLDTNVLIRMAAYPDTLGHNAWDLIEGGVVFASAISHFEIVMKQMLDKLDAPVDDLGAHFAEQGITPLPFTERHAAHAADFESIVRHDPFDRMLVAQAKSEGMPFLTSDRTLLALGYDWIIDARQ